MRYQYRCGGTLVGATCQARRQQFIAVGVPDLFVDEDIAFATNLLRPGVPTELQAAKLARLDLSMRASIHL